VVKKKIAFAANSDLNFDQRLNRICASLSMAGFEVFILGRSFSNSIPLTTKSYQQARISLSFQKGKMAYIELNLRLFLYLVRKKMNALCSIDLDTLPACWLVSKLKNIPLVHDAHEYMEEVPEVYNRPVTKFFWRKIAKAFLPDVNLAYTVSHSLQEEFKFKYGKNFHLVRNISKTIQLHENHDFNRETGYWVFLGAVNQGRGLEEFLDVLPSTNRKLIVLGDGDKLKELKSKVEQMQMTHLVEFKGKVKPEEAAKILQKAWAGINLLRAEGLSYQYSLANKFFDYVHAGIPQICIRFPEYQKMMAEFEVGVLCDLQFDSILAATQLVSFPEKQAHFRNQALAARQIWNWEKESENLIRLWKQLLPET
jgi:glycosyltransferase involved in cell wall biosynthesis